LYICPPHPYTVATLPWETEKNFFNSIIHIYILQIIYVIPEENKLLLPCPPQLKMSPHYLVKCTTFSSFSFFHVWSTNLRYGRVAVVLLQNGLNFSRAWWTMQLISGGKDWKHVSMQKVVSFNICCSVAYLTFNLPHITIGSFQSYQCQPTQNWLFSEPPMFGGIQHTLSQMKKLCILQGSAVTFFRCGG